MAMTLTMAAMGPVTGRAGGVAYDRWFRWGLAGCAAGRGIVAAGGPPAGMQDLPDLGE